MQGQFADDLADLGDRYELLGHIGAGAFGTVLQARLRGTGDLVAIKRLRYDDVADGVPSHVIREVCVLRDVVHPNIVQLLDIHMIGAAQYNLVFEHAAQDLCRALAECRADGRQLPLRTLLEHSRDLLRGVQACHLRQIMHRDLKPQNILVTETGLKICDFGLARMAGPPRRTYTGGVVTLWYRAPELLLGAPEYGQEIDMWSSGCCLSELATCQPLLPGRYEYETILMIFMLLGTPTPQTWPEVDQTAHWKSCFPQFPPKRFGFIHSARDDLAEGTQAGDAFMDLVQGLLRMNPDRRMSASRASAHDVFKELPE